MAELRVDGGACVNDLLMQFQADPLGIGGGRVAETTEAGAAYLVGFACGVYTDPAELAAHWQVEFRSCRPRARARVAERLADWEHAVRQATAPAVPENGRAGGCGAML